MSKPEDRQYYIDFSKVRGAKIIEELGRTITRLAPEQPTCQLFTGHIGCGKSTELLRLKAELEQQGFHVVYFESSQSLDMADIDVTDILLAVAREVSQSLEAIKINLKPGYFKNLFSEISEFLQTPLDIGVEAELSVAQMCRELETARQDLQNRGEVLEAALQASLEFLLGLNDYLHDEIDSALVHYQQSLEFWRQSNYLERQGILLVNIALAYNRQSEKNQTENQRYWQESRNCFQQAIAIFEQAQRSDLLAKHITKLGEVLRCLQAWSELQSLVEKSLPLHQNYGTSLQLAQDYGFLAEVALEQSRWNEAHQLAEIGRAHV